MCYTYVHESNYNKHNGVCRMHKLAERLIEKHLSKVISEITLEICDKYFDVCFKEACEFPNPKDTTIGTCYRKLEQLAIKTVDLRLNALMEDVTSEMDIVKCSPTKNPFAAMAYSVWEEFLYYYDIKGYVENVISDEWQEKLVKLQQDGILDAEGDYTRA